MHVCTDQKLSDSGKLRCVATSTDVPEQASKFALGAGRGSAPEIGAHVSGLARSLVSSRGVLAAAVLKGVGAPGLRSAVACMTVEERAAEITGMLQLAADAEQL